MMHFNFNQENKVHLSKAEVLSCIDQQSKVTIIFEKGFPPGSDAEDVFRGIMGDIAFEESDEMSCALYDEGEIRHMFFICNDKETTPFNERGMAKRLIEDNYWTSVILHDHPIKNGFYAMVENIHSNHL